MQPQALKFAFFTPTPRTSSSTASKSLHDELKDELRRAFNGKLEELTSLSHAYMSYTVDGYANRVVIRYGQKLVGWPKEIPFLDLNGVGGSRTLQTLKTLWDEGTLHFEPATAADRASAKRDPRSVYPNAILLDSDSQQARHERTAIVVASPVFHPDDMRPLGEHPCLSGRSAVAAYYSGRQRRQRSDVKKARARPVRNPENRPLKRRRDGVKSLPFVIDDLTEHELGEPGAERPSLSGYLCVNDPLDEFVPALVNGGSSGDIEDMKTSSKNERYATIPQMDDTKDI
ncbi:hypothetical protein BD414DRAFT_577449 [Trametes punicea]|nr:hypothetical protein BD414DRAFT_577449 [Trametes punicea]